MRFYDPDKEKNAKIAKLHAEKMEQKGLGRGAQQGSGQPQGGVASWPEVPKTLGLPEWTDEPEPKNFRPFRKPNGGDEGATADEIRTCGGRRVRTSELCIQYGLPKGCQDGPACQMRHALSLPSCFREKFQQREAYYNAVEMLLQERTGNSDYKIPIIHNPAEPKGKGKGKGKGGKRGY